MNIDRRNWILSQCKQGERILDIGSANGWIFYGTELNVIRVDLDEYDLPNFYRMDAHDLKFPDKFFDVAVLGEILEHVKDPVKVLSEAKRVAHRLVITVPDEANWAKELYPYETLEQSLQRQGVKTRLELAKIGNPNAKSFYDGDNMDHLWHHRHYTRETLEEDLKKAGLNYNIEVLQYDGWSFFCVTAKELPLYRQYLEGKIKEGRCLL